jgi:methionine-rich copper-binding protein CopC
MNLVRTLLVTILAALGLLATTSPAWAHTTLTSSTPAQGATLASAPTEVGLTFAEAVTLPADALSITGPDGARWTVGTPTIAGRVVSAPVTPKGPAGRYTLAYKVIADDGDQIGGTVAFTLTAPATR